jgi:hypothetical protein
MGVNLGLFWDDKEFEFDEIFKIQPTQMLRKKLLSAQNFSIYYGCLYLTTLNKIYQGSITASN